MKKLTSLILVLCLVAGIFAGCGKQIDDGPAPNPNGPVVSGDQDPGEDIPAAPGNTNVPGADTWNGYDLTFVKDNGLEYIWENLDNETKANLASALTAIKNCNPFIPLEYSIDKETNDEFMKLILNCAMDYPYVVNKFGVQDSDQDGKVDALTAKFNFNVIESEEDAWALTEELNARLDEIVSGMPQGTQYEQLRYLHDTLVFFSDYSEDTPFFYTAYGALVVGKATCQGYADAMHLLLSRAGFETCFCIGIGNNEALTHKWNYVKLDDGQWYILDPTWADPSDHNDDPSYICYDYFLISDEEILKDHKVKYESPFFPVPVATSMDMNYHKMEGYYCTSYEEALASTEEQVRLCAEEGRHYVYLRFSDANVYEQVKNDLFTANKGDGTNGELLRIIKEVNAEKGNVFSTSGWGRFFGYKDGQGPMTMIITLRYPE